MVRQTFTLVKKPEMPCPKCTVRKMHDTYSIMSSQGKRCLYNREVTEPKEITR